jgi:hypothetical protein
MTFSPDSPARVGQSGPGSQIFQGLSVAEDGLKNDRGTIGVQPGKVDLTAFDDGSEIDAGSMLKFLADTYSMALHLMHCGGFVCQSQLPSAWNASRKLSAIQCFRLLETRLKPAKKHPKVESPGGRRPSRTRTILVRPRARFRESTNTKAIAHF